MALKGRWGQRCVVMGPYVSKFYQERAKSEILAILDQTILPILTNNGSLKSLLPKVCCDWPRFVKIRHKAG